MTPDQIFRQHLNIRLKAPHEHAGKALERSVCPVDYDLFNGLGRPSLKVTPKDYVHGGYDSNFEGRFVISCGWLIDHQDQWEVTDERWTRIYDGDHPTVFQLRSRAKIEDLARQEKQIVTAPEELTYEQIRAWNDSVRPESAASREIREELLTKHVFIDPQEPFFHGSGSLTVPRFREFNKLQFPRTTKKR